MKIRYDHKFHGNRVEVYRVEEKKGIVERAIDMMIDEIKGAK